ncbi:hypothetical protein BBJ28_00011204 [Nothophytophthora sp. Chile5]|nr:hypothetical protein BBJ28_00011204 [Nothophytophthora sp. Chile5]
MDNADRLAKYENELQLFHAGVFPPQLWWMLVQLHMPEHSEVELVEFLEGAKVAAEVQLKAVNSKEFAEFAAGWVDTSPLAEVLSAFCSPNFYENIKRAAADTLTDRNMTLELQEIDIAHVEVTSVQYSQLTETQYDAQMAGLAQLPFFWSADATIEYLQIQVTTRSTETTKMTLVDQEECIALQDNTRTWTFGSKVGSPEELEWRIVDTVGRNNAAKQLSRTVYADETTGDSEEPALEREDK